MTGRLLLTCAPPAAGKDTVLAEWVRDGWLPPEAVLSADSVRRSFAGTAADIASDDAVWAVVHSVMHERLSRHLPTTLAATGINPGSLEGHCAVASESDSDVAVLRLDVDRRTLHERNRARRRSVPSAVLDAFVDDFNRRCAPEQLARRCGGLVYDNPQAARDWLVGDGRWGWVEDRGRTMTHCRPVHDNSRFTAILLPASGSARAEIGSLYAMLTRRLAFTGVSSLRVDVADSGDPALSADPLPGMVGSVVAEIDAATRRDGRPPVVVAFSVGADLALAVASRAEVSGMCLWSPVSTADDVVDDIPSGIAPSAGHVFALIGSQDSGAVAWLRRQPIISGHEYRIVDGSSTFAAPATTGGWTERDTLDATVEWFARSWSTILAR